MHAYRCAYIVFLENTSFNYILEAGWSTNYQSDLFFSDDSLSNKLSFGNGNNIYRTLQLDFSVAISIKYINCLVG